MKKREKRGERQTKGRKKRAGGGRSERAAPRRVSLRVHCPLTCGNCAWAMRAVGHWQQIIMSRWPGLLLCLNHPDAPGHLAEVACNGTCRNFRPKPAPAVRLEPPEPPNDKVWLIPLTQGKFALVDADDYEWLTRYKWRATFSGKQWYAATTIKNKNVLMHPLIMDVPKGMVIDHIDRKGCTTARSI